MRVSKTQIAAVIAVAIFAATPAFAGDKGHGGHGDDGNGNINVSASFSHATGGHASATGGNATANGGAGGAGGAGGSVVNTNNNSADNNGNHNGNNNGNFNGNNGNNGHNGNNGNNGHNGNNGNNNSSSSNSLEQSQSQSVDSSSSNNSSQNVNVNSYDERDPVHTAFAAPLTTGEDTCMGSSSVGAQAVSFGMSIGTTWQDSNCRRLKNSRQLVALGYHRAATALMCVDDDVRNAMIEAGTPCPSRDDPQQVAPVAAAPAAVACPTENFLVHFEWDRSNLNREAVETIDNAVARARQCNLNGAVVIGHTDTSGSNAYNERLSERRSAVVRDALVARGIPAAQIRTESRGERDLARATGDGVREGLNRRTAVTISFQ